MTYNRKDLSVQVSIKSVKGYTMREIGALDERIRRLEYYTVLNALELDTKTLSIRDSATNLERFKNGIFADPFTDHALAKTSDREYRIAISPSLSIARPCFDQLFHNFKILPASSSGIKVAGRIAMLNHTSEFLGGNPFATVYRNCTDSTYKFNGYLRLFPNFDNVNQTTLIAAQTVTIDVAKGFSDLLATGIAQNIDTVVGGSKIDNSVTEAFMDNGTKTTNYWSQTTTTTIRDIAVNVKPINVDLGSFVKDVSTLPYMRSRRIAVVAYGLKPNTRLYAYFDRVNVSAQCAPATVNSTYANATGQIDNTAIQNLPGGREEEVLRQNGVLGAQITSNSLGEAYLIFTLPPNTFRSGDRTFILTNVDNINAVDAIITRAEGTYTSSALAVTSQQVSFNILQPEFTPTTVVNSNKNTWEIVDTWVPQPPHGDPVAQTFTVRESTPTGIDIRVPGVYITQIGTFFKSKSSSLGITCVVAQTTTGIPDRSKILGRCHINSGDVAVSNDSSLETSFTFDTPILLQTDQYYTFWLEPDGTNPDYELWISEVGGTDVVSGRAVTQQPISGIMYVSSDGRAWTPVQSSDIKFKLYRAKFSSTTGTAVFRNQPDDFLTVNNILRSASGNPVAIGDVVYVANNSNLTQTLTDTTSKPFGVVSAIDELNGLMYLENTNGLFNTSLPNLRIYRVPQVGNSAYVTNTYFVANATLISVDNPSYHGLVPKFNILEPIGTSTTLSYAATANNNSSFSKDSFSTPLKNESLHLYRDYERVIRSYSNEVAAASYGTLGTATFSINLTTDNEYVSPVIDLGSKTFNFIKNLINDNLDLEYTRYGSALNKYISKNVVLNQEAEDLIVYVTGYRPAGTDITVYGKFLNNNDQEQFDQKYWSILQNQQAGIYGSPQDTEDYREYVYYVPTGNTSANQETAYLDPAAIDPLNVITYYDNVGRNYTGFSTFGIKIVLTSDNPVKIPTMRDVRAIALQK